MIWLGSKCIVVTRAAWYFMDDMENAAVIVYIIVIVIVIVIYCKYVKFTKNNTRVYNTKKITDNIKII